MIDPHPSDVHCRPATVSGSGELTHLSRQVAQLQEHIAHLMQQGLPLHDGGDANQSTYQLILQLREANQNLLLASFGAQDRQQAAEAANRAKEDFLALLAHELRTPLAPIAMATALLGKVRGGDAQLERIYDVLGRQTGLLTRLVDDLLDASRMTSGKLTLQRRVVALAEVLNSAIETVQPMLSQSEQLLVVDAPTMSMLMEVDPPRIAQALSNLLHNAAKFSPRNSTITLSVRLSEHAVTLTVSDHGIGIAPEIQPLIFDLFAQSSRALNRQHGGLGIGLSLTRSIVELHGGTVAAVSDGVGSGSQFVLALPYTPGLVPDIDPVTTRGARQVARILIIEDNRDTNQTLASFLALEGYSVQAATSSAEGLRLAQASRFELIICDIGLPGTDGYDVVTHLRHALQPVPCFIALTGYNQLEHRIRAIEAGFDHYLVKPVAIHTLLDVIAMAVSSR